MRKKYIVMCLILGLQLSVLSGCSSHKVNEDTNKLINSVAENGVVQTEIPQGCEISDTFVTPMESQDFIAETDCNNTISFTASMDSVNDDVYFIRDRYLWYLDKSTMEYNLVCSRPDCEHTNEECTAFVSEMRNTDVDIYEDSLYVVAYVDEGEKTLLKLIKIAKDGSEREAICTLAEATLKNEDTLPSVRWVIHRGYIYYAYTLGNGYTADSYYLNGSNCIYQKSITGGESKCIIALDIGLDINLLKLKATGSYLYFVMPTLSENGISASLYRYNDETAKIESLNDVGKIADYALTKDAIYYKKTDDSYAFYVYDFNNGTADVAFVSEEESEECYLEIDADETYIYGRYRCATDGVVRYVAYEQDGKRMGSVDIEGGYNFLGMDDDYLYFQNSEDVGISYVSKEMLVKNNVNLERLSSTK